MSIELVWQGVDALDRKFVRLREAADKATQEALLEAGNSVATYTRAMFDGMQTRPTRRSGRLADSIRVDQPKKANDGGWATQVGPTGVAYARIIELGRKGERSRAPHPYLRPGFAEAGKTFDKIFRDAWKRAGV